MKDVDAFPFFELRDVHCLVYWVDRFLPRISFPFGWFVSEIAHIYFSSIFFVFYSFEFFGISFMDEKGGGLVEYGIVKYNNMLMLGFQDSKSLFQVTIIHDLLIQAYCLWLTKSMYVCQKRPVKGSWGQNFSGVSQRISRKPLTVGIMKVKKWESFELIWVYLNWQMIHIF